MDKFLLVRRHLLKNEASHSPCPFKAKGSNVLSNLLYCVSPFLATMNVAHEIDLLVVEIKRLGTKSESGV